MRWMVAMLAVLAVQDGGTSDVPLFHEPMTRPVPLKRPDWRYPPELVSRRVSGLVILKCVLSEEGVAEDCEVVKPLQGATEWAIGQVKSTRYTPVTLDGKPIRVRYVFNVRLTAPGGPVAPIPPARWQPIVPTQVDESCRGPTAAMCQQVALSLLRPDAGSADVDRAARLLGAACDAGQAAACEKLERSFVGPALLEALPQPPVRLSAPVQGDATRLVSVQGRAHDCMVAPGSLSEWVSSQLPDLKFSPAKYEGSPFETEHGIHYVLYPHK